MGAEARPARLLFTISGHGHCGNTSPSTATGFDTVEYLQIAEAETLAKTATSLKDRAHNWGS